MVCKLFSGLLLGGGGEAVPSRDCVGVEWHVGAGNVSVESIVTGSGVGTDADFPFFEVSLALEAACGNTSGFLCRQPPCGDFCGPPSCAACVVVVCAL